MIYFTLEGNDYLLSGHENKTFEYGLGKLMPFESKSKTVHIHIEGETFILDNNESDSDLNLEADKTLNLYLSPTNACIKLNNNRDVVIDSLIYTQHFPNNTTRSSINLLRTALLPHSNCYSRIPYATDTTPFYYTFRVVTADDSVFYYGGDTTYLYLDEVYTIDFH